MRQVFWFTAVLLIGVYICAPLQDPDLWWHIASGRWILAHGKVPNQDHWTLFSQGQPWRAYSWSNEVILALIERNFGEKGLLLLKMGLACAIAATFFYCFAKIAGDYFFGALIGTIATASCFNHFTLRPQSVVWIYLLVLIYFCDSLSKEPAGLKPLLGLFITMLLWANTHLSAILGIGAVAAWLWPAANQHSYLSEARMAKGLLAAFLGTLFTPYFGGEWLTFLTKSHHPFDFQAISEFQPANILQYSSGFFIVVLAFLLSLLHLNPKALRIPQLLACAAFGVGGLAVVKFLPFAVIVLCAAVAQAWRASKLQPVEFRGSIGEGLQRLRRLLLDTLPAEGLSFVFVCLSIVNVLSLWRYPLELRIVPARAVDFIQEWKLPHPILNTFGHGGYLIYRFSNADGEIDQPVSIDGRTNLIPKELWQKYLAAQTGKLDWRAYLESVKPKTILWKVESPLVSLLVESKQWCIVFRDTLTDGGESSVVLLDRAHFESRTDSLQSENCGK